MEDETAVSKAYPLKPKLKPTPKAPSKSPESKYWSSFKNHDVPNLIGSVPSITFSSAAPHRFAVAHSASLSFFSPKTLEMAHTISSFRDVVSSVSFRSDGALIAASDVSGLVQVFDVKTRAPLRKLKSHTRPVRFVKYPVLDKLHLVSGGDDGLVKYWDVATESMILNLKGHKDYVRCGDCSPVSFDSFVTGSYDHVVKLWDVRVGDGNQAALEINHGKPVEDVVFLPSGGLVASVGGNSVKLWDLISGGKLVYSMESHNKTVTSICVGQYGNDNTNESKQNRILSVGLDGYMKVFDYTNFKVTHSMRYPAALLSVAFSPDSKVRVIGTSKGIVYAGKRKGKEAEEEIAVGGLPGFGRISEQPQRRALNPSFYRYFHRGQIEKPSEGDFLVMKPKKVKLSEHDKLLRKFRHKDALVHVLGKKNPENTVAVMEELVARRKLLKCASNLDSNELGLLLRFLQKYSTVPRYSKLLMGLVKKIVDMRSEDIRASDELKALIRNLKSTVEEEVQIQQELLEIQGIISPLLKMSGR